MIPILDFQQRSLDGPVMKAMQFDLAFSKKLRELVAQHEIVYDAEELVVDDATADRIFDAGVQLLAGVGLYHLDTHRVVTLAEEEIREVAREYRDAPPEVVFGRGEERLSFRYRTSEEERPPILAAGPAGAIEQDWFVPYVQSFAQEPSIRALGIAGGITAVDGQVPKAGTLSEMHCAQWECEQLNEIVDRIGRPDMHLGLLCTASSMGAITACMRPGLREAWNTQIGVHIIPEQKIDWTRLMLAKYCEDSGITPWTSCVSVMGGLCRHGPDVAVGLVANLLGQLCYGHGTLANIFVNRMNGSWGDAETQWATSGASRAAERNIRVPIAGVCVPGPDVTCTEAAVLQASAVAVSNTANGFAYAWIAGGSGIEARLLGEVM
ncbi:MAG: monomethylamine:corrinoid methyltransferase, partial [Deltaproteobacteria bacterium]|nr:monomethylamine:corrinoid methyltransferase [Deltaproteobacteria bacterium]